MARVCLIVKYREFFKVEWGAAADGGGGGGNREDEERYVIIRDVRRAHRNFLCIGFFFFPLSNSYSLPVQVLFSV
jgi:hypothetical protein